MSVASRMNTDAPNEMRETMKVINWLSAWWTTWRVWRRADEEQRRILTSPFDPDEYVEVERPGDGL